MKPLYLSILVVLLFHCGCQKEKDCTKGKEENKPTGVDWHRMPRTIWYAEDGVTVTDESGATYDEQGRYKNIICFLGGKLCWESHDFTYNGNECIYYKDEYIGLTYDRTTTNKMTCAGDWLKLTSFMTYMGNDTANSIYQRLTYNTGGQKTGEYHTINGEMFAAYTDYTYTGNEVTFYYKRYTDGVVTSANKYRHVNFSNWLLLNSEVTYANDGITEEERTDDIFDTEGRRMNRKIYRYGTLIQEWKDYVYTDNECTFNVCNISSGTSQKAKMIFFKW